MQADNLSGVYTESGAENMAASTASIVFVWLYLGVFNVASEFTDS